MAYMVYIRHLMIVLFLGLGMALFLSPGGFMTAPRALHRADAGRATSDWRAGTIPSNTTGSV